MFTGIVQTTLPVTKIIRKTGLYTYAIEFSDALLVNLQIGASVSVSGVCLTVSQIEKNNVYFDVMAETLEKTNLSYLKENDTVNIERSAKIGDEIGGHLLSGHVNTTVQIIDIRKPDVNNYIIQFKSPPEYMRYILPKGYIALDGCSLTIVSPSPVTCLFEVHLIPETLRVTTFKNKQVGDLINMEIDSQTIAIVNTIESYLTSNVSYVN